MKKATFLLPLFLFSLIIYGQVILDESFQGTTFPPANWTTSDVDGKVVASGLPSFFSSDQEQASLGSGNGIAFSTSAYTPTGASDDWLISPALVIPAASSGKTTVLSYQTLSLTTATLTALGDYELRVSTTGNATTDFTTVMTVNGVTTAGVFEIEIVDMSQFAGQTIYVAWRDISNNAYVFGVDAIKLETIFDDAISLDAMLLPQMASTLDSIEIVGTVNNKGANAITSFEVSWSENGGNMNRDTLTGLNIEPFSSMNFTHKTKLKTTSAAGHFNSIDVAVSKPNAKIDSVTTDDSLTTTVFIIKGIGVKRNVLLEEFATAPCQFCPDGAATVEEITMDDPNLIPVVHHAGFSVDAMTIPEHSTYAAAFTNGAPNAMIDRIAYDGEGSVAFPSRDFWKSRAKDRANVDAPVELNYSGAFDAINRDLDFTIEARFTDYVIPGDLRLTVFLVEDSVSNNPSSGYDSNWDQVNAYYARAGHPYENKGIPFAAPNQNVSYINDFVYRHVVRDVYPSNDAFGDTIFSFTPVPNSIFEETITLPINSNWDQDLLTVVAFVSYYDADVRQRVVLNAKQMPLLEINTSCNASYTIKKDTSSAFAVSLTNTSTNESSHEYSWDFGDGTIASGRTPTHTYQNFGSYEVCLTITDTVLNCGSSFCDSVGMDSLGNLKAGFTISVKNSVIVGIEDVSDKELLTEFNIYPNPVKNSANVLLNFSEKRNVDIMLFDITGEKLIEQNHGNLSAGEYNFPLNLSNFANGLYIVNLRIGNEIISRKISVNR